MKHLNLRTTALVLSLALLATGCGDSSSIGIIGGADGPTSIIVGRGETPPAESPPAVSDSSSESTPAQGDSQPASQASASSAASSQSTASTSSSVASQSPASASSSAASSAANTSSDIAFTQSSVKAGNMTTLVAPGLSAGELSITADFGGSFQFFDLEEAAQAYIGVSRNIEPGSYTVTVQQKGQTLATLPLTVLDGGFQTQSFQMDQSVQDSTVNNTAARDAYNKMLDKVNDLATATPNLPDLESGFIMPIRQQTFKISSAYGYTRIVNDKVSGRHEGVDFPAPAGTPVVATGAGKVIFSDFIQMTGNTVVIEHGMGIKSWYCHLSALDCAEGDQLAAGDPVGKVGTTGYSTGNHLHFGMAVNDIYTNPWQFVPYPG